MILKSHLCGIAVAFDRFTLTEEQKEYERGLQAANRYPAHGGNISFENEKVRAQGSLYSWQKRKIADACEYMRIQPVHKPIIFVATSPGFTDHASENKLISKLTANLRNGYACENYVWVREFTGAGFPHFHFVADMPNFDAIKLSLYWSSLFDSDAKNSIRIGSKPDKNGKRNYYLTGKRHAWYLTKYLTKAIGNEEKGALESKRSFRTFAVSRQLTKLSLPVEFESKEVKVQTKTTMKADGKFYPFYEYQRHWASENSTITDHEVKTKWKWQYTGFANTHKGFPKQWKLKQNK